jgi:pyruvate formate lyase activating enzyme
LKVGRKDWTFNAKSLTEKGGKSLATDEAHCRLSKESFKPGSCLVYHKGRRYPACKVTLKWENDVPSRLIEAAHLSRPEHYFSIYQSGCNFNCRKCHSWYFSQYATGSWHSPKDIAKLAEEYAATMTVVEPRDRATSFHAHDLCRSCGHCFLNGERSPYCPGKLEPHQVIPSPQGPGPARNIIAFTGGDLACQPEFYAESTRKIKALDKNLWVLFETNGYGLTPENLDHFREAGIDSFWLDIKAYNDAVHKRLTGCHNDWILRLPGEIKRRDFVLEVLSLYIPGWVEEDQIGEIARLIASVDKEIPFTILAFFAEHLMKDVPSPNLHQMLSAYEASIKAGLRHVRLGNIGIFIKGERDFETLISLGDQAW